MANDTGSGEGTPFARADIRAFLFADIRGYTRFTQERGDDAASALAGRFADVVGEAVPVFEGELLELRGDEALCVFRSARQALRAAVELQRRLRTATDDHPAFPLGVGTGLDAGEAVPTKGGYRGASLNLAARLCAAAAGGEVLATERLVGLAGSVAGVEIGPPRSLPVRGLRSRERVMRVTPDEPLPPAPRPPGLSSGSSRRRRVAAGAAVVLAVVGGTFVVTLSRRATGLAASVPVRINSVAVIDPDSGRVIRDITVGVAPSSIATGYGDAWTANAGSGTVSRIGIHTMSVFTFGLLGSPSAIAAGMGSVWAYDNDVGRIFQIDPTQNPPGAVNSFALRACTQVTCDNGEIATGYGRVWVGDGQQGLYSLNPATHRFRHVPATIPAHAVAAANGLVYTSDAGTIAWIDPHTDAHDTRVLIGDSSGYGTLGIAAAPSAVWAVSPLTGQIYRVDPTTLSSTAQRTVAAGLESIAIGGGSAWVTNQASGTLIQLALQSARVVRVIHLGKAPTAVAYANGHVWVTIENPKALIDP